MYSKLLYIKNLIKLYHVTYFLLNIRTMQQKITQVLAVIVISAFGMIAAPTLSTINAVFAATSIDSFFDKNGKISIDNILKYSSTIPKHTSNSDSSKSGKDTPKSGKDTPKSGGSSHSGEPCGSNGGNTKEWYCHGTHHHCAKGQDNCELEGGRT